MQGAVLHSPGDVRFEERTTPRIIKPTDAIIRMSATCVCGSDLWPYRGIQAVTEPTPMGHEYCGVVEEVGSAVTSVKPGQFVIGSFFASDNTCPHCHTGYQTSCQHKEFVGGAQAPLLRVPLADGTLVAPNPEPVGAVRCYGDRLVRSRSSERQAGHDRGSRRRWGGRSPGHSLGEAKGS